LSQAFALALGDEAAGEQAAEAGPEVAELGQRAPAAGQQNLDLAPAERPLEHGPLNVLHGQRGGAGKAERGRRKIKLLGEHVGAD